MTVLRLYLHAPVAIFKARVNAPSGAVYPVDSLSFDTVTLGAYTDIEVDTTVLLGSTEGGDDYGRQRVRKAPTSDTLYIGRSSQGTRDGELIVTDNAYITVLNDRRVWSKIPYIDDDGNVFKDSDLTVGTNTTTPPPKSNGGEPFAATITGGVITVDFDGTTSYGQAGATISSYLWDVQDGTITVGTSTSSTITATFPAGLRFVSLTVTDSNSKTHTHNVPVYARDPANDTTVDAFTIERHSIKKEGQQIAFRVLSDLPASTYPDGTLAILWEGEPDGPGDREHIRFWGWHHTDPATITSGRTGILRDTVLECLDVAGKLDTLPGFPISIENKETPASWLEMKSPNMALYLDYLLRWHSTALELANFTPAGENYPFVILGSDGQSLFDQVNRRAQSLVPDHHFTCDTRGQLAIRVDPLLQDVADRTSTIQTTLTESDWQDIRYTHQRPPTVHWLRAEAILASASEIAAVFAIGPGLTPGQGVSESSHGEQLALSQGELNACEGHRYARLNAEQTLLNITLVGEFGGALAGIEPANLTWVRLNVTTATAVQRGLFFTNARGLPHEVNVRYNHGRTGLTRTVTITWEEETSGTPATTYIPPDTIDVPDWEPPPNTGFEPPVNIIIPGTGLGTAYYMNTMYLYRTRNLSALSPTWVNIAPSGIGSILTDFILDPHTPKTAGYLLTTDGVYRPTNLDLTTPTWVHSIDAADIMAFWGSANFQSAFKIIASINVQGANGSGHVGFAYKSGNSTRYSVTADSGATWSHYTIQTGGMSGGASEGGYSGGLDYVPKLVDGQVVLFFSRYFDAIVPHDIRLYRSLDSGQTWVLRFNDTRETGSTAGGISVHCPYDNNASGLKVYWTEDGATWYSDDGGATRVQVVPIAGAFGGHKRHGLETWTPDEDRLYMWYGKRLFTTAGGPGGTWTEQIVSGLTGTAVHASGGFPYNNSQFYAVTDEGVFVSTDGGESFMNKTGDIALNLDGEIIGETSPFQSVIVPLWIAE